MLYKLYDECFIMTENEISKIIVHVCFDIHYKLGPGLFETVYESILTYELIKKGLNVERQKPIPVNWDGITIDQSFHADLIVNDKDLIEIKSIATIAHVHKKQVLTYLKLTGLKLGLLINFNEALIKNGIIRIVNGL